MNVGLVRSANGSAEIIPWRLSLVTPPAGGSLTINEAKGQCRVDDSAGEPSPATAPLVALAGLGAGVCANGSHRVACSYVTPDGETVPGPLSAPVAVADQTVNGQLAVSQIPIGGSAVTTVKLWMPLAGFVAPLLYAGSVANGVTTATINLADGSLGVQAPIVNTTLDPQLKLWMAAANSICESEPSADGSSGGTGRALQLQTWDLRMDRFPNTWADSSFTMSGFLGERTVLGGGGVGHGPTRIPKPPLVSVTYIQYVDTTGALQTWDPSLYVVDMPTGDYAECGRIAPAYGQIYPPTQTQPAAVTIRFVCGYGVTPAAVPAPLKIGQLLLIGNWFLNREAGQIIRGSADILPFGVDALWQAFRVL